MTESTMADQTRTLGLPRWALAVIPLILLALLLGLFVQFNPIDTLTGAGSAPPVEELSIQQVQLRPEGIIVSVINGGPEPVTIAQVLIDEAYWEFSIEPAATLDRLERATISVPYPWVDGEAHEIRLITNTGATFDASVDVATETPQPDINYWLLFALLGFYVGVVPVGLGVMWFPVLRQLSRRALNFILALTVGLLVFLLIDTVLEALEVAETLPAAFQGVPMISFGILLSFLILIAVSRTRGSSDRSTRSGRLWLATAIAIGIGLHNLGEGMAIGASIALGEAALGSFLVIGFTLHNITEGVGIGAPIARDEPGIWRLAGLALLAGAPAILGTWLGGFAYSPLLAALFLSIGAGAILQVVYEVGRLVVDNTDADVTFGASWVNLAGVTAGIAIMYVTALLVKF